jgi:hypothetical protein
MLFIGPYTDPRYGPFESGIIAPAEASPREEGDALGGEDSRSNRGLPRPSEVGG